MEELTGWSNAEVRGKDWFETFIPEHARPDVADVHAAIIGASDYPHYVNPILTKSGEERLVGRGELHADVRMVGLSEAEIRRSLNGTSA